MRYFKDKSSGSYETACSYCRQSGHNASNCKIAVWDYNEWYNGRVPKDNPHGQRPRWYEHYENYSKWFRDSMRATQKYQAREDREAKKKLLAHQQRPTRAKPKCGFCGAEDHNRRNCPKMQQVIADASKANYNWRMAFYNSVVKERGLSVGAAIQVDTADGYYGRDPKPELCMGLITSINLSELSFLSSQRNISHDFGERLQVIVNINGQTRNVQFEMEDRSSYSGKSAGLAAADGTVLAVQERWGRYGTAKFVSQVGRSVTELDEAWVSDGLQEEFSFLTKRKSYDWLEENGIIKAIDQWK